MEKIKITLFSCNLANGKDISKLPTAGIVDETTDIFVEMTQEDFRPLGKSSIFQVSSRGNLTYCGFQSLNNKSTTQNLVMRMYAKGGGDIVIDKGSMPIAPKGKANWKYSAQKTLAESSLGSLGYSKGMVWMKIKGDHSMLFVNMHLPMSSKKEGLGLAMRKAAFGKLLNHLAPLVDNNTCVFIGGDLNFRMDYSGFNQLTDLLEKRQGNKMSFLQEIDFINPADRRFTCKFRSLVPKPSIFGAGKMVDAACAEKRLTSVPLNSSKMKNTMLDLQKRCGFIERIPSRCDRFLARPARGMGIEVLAHKADILIPDSDHNAIYTTFNIVADQSAIFQPWTPISENSDRNESGNESASETSSITYNGSNNNEGPVRKSKMETTRKRRRNSKRSMSRRKN